MPLDSATGSILKPSDPSLGRVLRYSDLASLPGTTLFFDSGGFSLRSRDGRDPGRSWGYVPGSSFNKTIADFYAPNVKVTTDAHQGRHGGTINFARAEGSCGTAQAVDFATNPAYWNTTTSFAQGFFTAEMDMMRHPTANYSDFGAYLA